MARRLFPVSALSVLILLTSCVTLPMGARGTLQDQVAAIISTPPLDQVHWGIRIVDPERGRVLYSRNAHRKFIPASNMKVLSTAAALSLLGPEYRYETSLWRVGQLVEEGSVLNGDLLLRATGDPTLSERFHPTAEAPLDSLAEGLWAAGIRYVAGALVVDVSAWDSTTVPGSWMMEDLPGTSGATGGAFAIAEGVLTLEAFGGRQEGDPAQTRWWPFSDEESISADIVTVHPDSSSPGRRTRYFPESGRLRVQGGVGAGEVDTLRFSQRNPIRLAANALLQALERRGVEIRDGVRIAWDAGDPVGPADAGSCVTGPSTRGGDHQEEAPALPGEPSGHLPECPDAVRVAGITSPPLAEIVKAILEPSQNWMTEQLVRTLGAELGPRGSWREGFLVEGKFLTEQVGVDSLDLTFRDGSGMSTQNLVTPRALVQILEYMRSSPHSGLYRGALASPGEEDSTLRSRLPGLENRVFAKTGTLTHVTSLSGYVFTDSGRELIFSILTNGSGLSSRVVRRGIDRVVEVITRH